MRVPLSSFLTLCSLDSTKLLFLVLASISLFLIDQNNFQYLEKLNLYFRNKAKLEASVKIMTSEQTYSV